MSTALRKSTVRPLGVRKAPIFQHLQEDIKHFLDELFNLVQEHSQSTAAGVRHLSAGRLRHTFTYPGGAPIRRETA